MKTNSFTKLCLSLVFIICLFSNGNAQEPIPKNYFGISGIAELNRLSVGCGVEYERWLYTKNRFVLGAKLNYIFPSRTLNYIFSSDNLLQKNSQTQLMGSTYFFTGKEKKPEGFFLSFGLGLNFIKWSQETADASGNYYIMTKSEVAPGFEISLGGQFELKNRKAIRFSTGYQAFSADKYNLLIGGNGIALLYTKISIGF